MKILILGVNGFIGHHLVNRILAEKPDWQVSGMDLGAERIGPALNNPRFNFLEGDISINKEWIEYHIKKCDVIMPLVAIATPKAYAEDPIGVYNLNFEMNINIIKQCVKYGKRVVFPSTSEVYGACTDAEFSEDESFLVTGPINKERWIYSCSKQLLDRVIYAYGTRGHLEFTLFRPFNWVGPRLDGLDTAKEGSSRVVTQFIAELLLKRPIKLVDGGLQKRCFTYVDDGITALMKILENKNNICKNEIINIGNPHNECSVKELATLLKKLFKEHPQHKNDSTYSEMVEIPAETFYGKGYQDILTRKPSIEKAKRLLGWEPKISFEQGLDETVKWYLDNKSWTQNIQL